MDNKNNKIYKYLLSYGFSPRHKGFKLIIEAVTEISERDFKYKSLSDIYDVLSEKYKISPYGVQKNIKNAIDYANLRCRAEEFNAEFGHICEAGGITCAAFLCHVATKFKYSAA